MSNTKQINDLEEKLLGVYENERYGKRMGRLLRNELHIDDVHDELKLHQYDHTDVFPEDLLPPATEYSTLEQAVFFAVKHAYLHHYQLVPRLRHGVWYLHCDRMAADEIDAVQMKHMEQTDDEWVDQTVRKSCGFALKSIT